MEERKKFRLPVSKKAKRIIIATVLSLVGVFLLIMIGLSIYITSSEKRLITFLNDKLKETILGELRINKAEITVWQTFPKIGITLSDVTISDSFYRKPFLNAGYIRAKAGLLDLIGSKLTISSVKIKDARVYAFTDSSGYSNTYVLRPQNKPKRKSRKPVVLSNLELENVVAISEDVIKNKRYEVRITEAEADMALRGSTYYIKLDEDVLVRGLGFNLEKGYWLENQRVEAKWKLEYDTAKNILSFGDTEVEIQDQSFEMNGAFYLNPPAHFKINATAKGIDYNAAMAMLKPTTSVKIKKLNLAEPVDVTVLLDGPLAYRSVPLVKVDFDVKDNNINTPVVNFSECNFSGSFINQVDTNLPRTDENSRVTINAFSCNWGDINFKAPAIVVTDLHHPILQFAFFSQCTLPQLDEQVSSSTIQFLEGNAKLYLAYNGPLIADPSLLNQLNANIEIRDGKVIYVPRSITFSECNGAISINGSNLLMKDFQCNLNTNHFVVNVAGQHLNRISAMESGKATINCNVYTPALDLSDFRALFAKKSTRAAKKTGKSLAATARSIDNAVENGDLFIDIKANKVSLHHFTANNVVANIFFKEDDWEIKRASLQHADGGFNLMAKVHQLSNGYHQANAHVNLQHINVKKLFYGFDNFGQTGITYDNLKGMMDSKANINAQINNAGKLIPGTMNGVIDFSLKDAALVNFEALKNIQKYIFKKRNLDNVEFADLENTLTIKKGDVYIPRMPIQSSAITMYVEGVYSFADRTDISIQVPLSTLKNKPEDYETIDKAKAAKPGASIYFRAKEKNGQVKIGLDAFKKLRKNKYKEDASE